VSCLGAYFVMPSELAQSFYRFWGPKHYSHLNLGGLTFAGRLTCARQLPPIGRHLLETDWVDGWGHVNKLIGSAWYVAAEDLTAALLRYGNRGPPCLRYYYFEGDAFRDLAIAEGRSA
jgi:hypothetical protein